MGRYKVWTIELIEKTIREVMQILGIDVMPTERETCGVTGDNGLYNAIRSEGGIYEVASKLNIPLSEDSTAKSGGNVIEVSSVQLRMTFPDYPCGRAEQGCDRRGYDAERCTNNDCLIWQRWFKCQWHEECENIRDILNKP